MKHDKSNFKCPECGKPLYWFNEQHSDLVCEECGYSIDPWADDYQPPEPDNIPEGCAACGGPYPNCTSSCNLFDD